MSGFPVRARLTATYLTVLTTATLILAGGAWWFFLDSIVRAADASLAARVEGTRRFIEEVQNELPREELADEFGEFAQLTEGQVLLEVSDEHGRTLCRPALAAWPALRVEASADVSHGTPLVAAGAPFRAVATDIEAAGHRYRVHAAIAMETQYAALKRFGWMLGALVPLVLVLGGAGGYWISGRALAPVDRIARDVQSITLQRLDARVAVPGAEDELRRLALTFNDMLARLQRAVADMVRFTAEAAHELRTPVSLARTTAELALARDRRTDEYRDALTEVLGYTERMSVLVDDLLTLARTDAGVEPPVLDPIDLRGVVADAARSVQPLAARRGTRLEIVVPDRPVLVLGSEEPLKRLSLILLDNAVKYTPADGLVRIQVARDRSDATLEVLDSGPGIDAADTPRVFDRFYRGALARQQAPDGTGLGLSIARAIVDRYGGRIHLGRGPDGPGCLVRIELPGPTTALP